MLRCLSLWGMLPFFAACFEPGKASRSRPPPPAAELPETGINQPTTPKEQLAEQLRTRTTYQPTDKSTWQTLENAADPCAELQGIQDLALEVVFREDSPIGVTEQLVDLPHDLIKKIASQVLEAPYDPSTQAYGKIYQLPHYLAQNLSLQGLSSDVIFFPKSSSDPRYARIVYDGAGSSDIGGPYFSDPAPFLIELHFEDDTVFTHTFDYLPGTLGEPSQNSAFMTRLKDNPDQTFLPFRCDGFTQKKRVSRDRITTIEGLKGLESKSPLALRRVTLRKAHAVVLTEYTGAGKLSISMSGGGGFKENLELLFFWETQILILDSLQLKLNGQVFLESQRPRHRFSRWQPTSGSKYGRDIPSSLTTSWTLSPESSRFDDYRSARAARGCSN